MGLLSMVNDLINEHGSAQIMRERLLLLRDQLEKVEADNERLTKENQRLQTENAELHQKLGNKTATEEFIKHRGVLFLRLPNGKIQDEVYCPDCQRPMNSMQRIMPYRCAKCRTSAGFASGELDRIIAEIQ